MALRKKHKAQMFIVTMIFLIGFIFSVQQNLFQYSEADVPGSMEQNDIYLLWNIRDLFRDTLEGSADCAEAQTRLSTLENYLNTRIFRGGYVLEVGYQLLCENWESATEAPLKLSITLTGEKTETVWETGLLSPAA